MYGVCSGSVRPMGRLIWRVLRPVHYLGVVPGDVLIYDPAMPHPWQVLRPLLVDPGAVMGAEDAGALEAIPPSGDAVTLQLVRSEPPHRPPARPRAADPQGLAG